MQRYTERGTKKVAMVRPLRSDELSTRGANDGDFLILTADQEVLILSPRQMKDRFERTNVRGNNHD